MKAFDYDWVRITGGCLTIGEKLRMVPSMALWLCGYLGGLTLLALQAAPDGARFSVSMIQRPPGRLADETDAVWRSMSPEMQDHAYRTWLIGACLAAMSPPLAIDPELFYCAALLHDFGLTLPNRPGKDFTLASAECAGQCADLAGVVASRKAALMDAICMHSTIGVSRRVSPLGYYVQWGSMGDLAGVRRWRLGNRNLKEIDRVRPRTTAARDKLIGLVCAEADSVPCGRFAFYSRAGMPWMMRLAPLRP